MPDHTLARRTVLLAGVGITLVVVATTAFLLTARSPDASTVARQHPAASTPARSTTPASPAGPSWDTAGENAIATAPMVALGPSAAQPGPLSTASAGPPISLPPAVAGLLPDTAAGALAQLAATDEQGLSGGDPADYARAYRAASEPNAPDPATTGLFTLLSSVRTSAGLPATGAAPGFTTTYQVTDGLIKGTRDSGRFAVVCVLGEFTAQLQGRTDSVGVGDCQALRWTGNGWRISPTRLAAAAPCAWPGSPEAAAAGYREVR
jgi:hypothetical protein